MTGDETDDPIVRSFAEAVADTFPGEGVVVFVLPAGPRDDRAPMLCTNLDRADAVLVVRGMLAWMTARTAGSGTMQ